MKNIKKKLELKLYNYLWYPVRNSIYKNIRNDLDHSVSIHITDTVISHIALETEYNVEVNVCAAVSGPTWSFLEELTFLNNV